MKKGARRRLPPGPDSVAAGDTQYYGTGAFLLAGTAMHDLARAERRR